MIYIVFGEALYETAWIEGVYTDENLAYEKCREMNATQSTPGENGCAEYTLQTWDIGVDSEHPNNFLTQLWSEFEALPVIDSLNGVQLFVEDFFKNDIPASAWRKNPDGADFITFNLSAWRKFLDAVNSRFETSDFVLWELLENFKYVLSADEGIITIFRTKV